MLAFTIPTCLEPIKSWAQNLRSGAARRNVGEGRPDPYSPISYLKWQTIRYFADPETAAGSPTALNQPKSIPRLSVYFPMQKLIPALILILIFSACQPTSPAPSPEQPEPPIILNTVSPTRTLSVGFLVLDSVYNSELIAPYDILQHTIFHADPGMELFTVARDTGILTTFEGLRLLPDYALESAPPIDILVVPSAKHNMDTDLEDERLINWVRDRGEKAQYIMSLCDGAFILARAGLLDGMNATTFPGDIDAFEKQFPRVKVHRDVSFVHHGKAITSAGGAKSYDPAMYLAELLYGKKAADGIAGGMVIDWDLRKVKHIRK